MGIFERIKNMTKAKVNDTLDNIENPIELCNQKVRDMEEQLNKAKLSSAQVLGNVREIEKKMNSAKNESAEWDEKVKLAVSKGNDELAKKALAKKIDADKSYESLKASYEVAQGQAEKIKKNLKDLESEIDKTRLKRDELEARYNNAEASKTVNEIIANVSEKNDSIRIDDIERKIQKKEAMAEGLGELAATKTSLEDEFKSLEEVDLDSELQKYKNTNK